MKIKPFNKPESQFTQLHNSIFDVIMRACRPSEWQVLCAVIRKTRGWDKPGDDISYSQIKEMTGIASSSTIASAVRGLVKKDMIIASTRTGTTTYYQLNQNYTIEQITSPKIEQVETDEIDLSKNRTGTSPKIEQVTSPEIGQVETQEVDQSKNRTGTSPKNGQVEAGTCPNFGHTKDSLNTKIKKKKKNLLINTSSSSDSDFSENNKELLILPKQIEDKLLEYGVFRSKLPAIAAAGWPEASIENEMAVLMAEDQSQRHRAALLVHRIVNNRPPEDSEKLRLAGLKSGWQMGKD